MLTDIDFELKCDTQKEERGSFSEQENQEVADSNQATHLKNHASNLETAVSGDLAEHAKTLQTTEPGFQERPASSIYPPSQDNKPVSPEFDSPSHKRLEIQMTNVKEMSIASNGPANNHRNSPIPLRAKSFRQISCGKFLVAKKGGPSRCVGPLFHPNKIGVASTLNLTHICTYDCK